LSRKPQAVIDGDILLYRCGFAVEKKVYELYEHTEEGLIPLPQFADKRAINKFVKENADRNFELFEQHDVQPPGYAIQALHTVLEGIMSGTACGGYKLFLSGPTHECFRSQVATLREYKGNRKDARRPVHYELLKQYMINKLGAQVVRKIEADDACAIHAPGNVVCSIDKDLLQVPGLHYRFTDDKPEVFEVDAQTGAQNLFTQILTGDTTDNIPGCPGIGETKAAEIIRHCATPKQMLQAVRSTFIERWPEDLPLSPDEALDENAALVYLLRNGEDKWDRKKFL
jgi:hypothetical protein